MHLKPHKAECTCGEQKATTNLVALGYFMWKHSQHGGVVTEAYLKHHPSE